MGDNPNKRKRSMSEESVSEVSQKKLPAHASAGSTKFHKTLTKERDILKAEVLKLAADKASLEKDVQDRRNHRKREKQKLSSLLASRTTADEQQQEAMGCDRQKIESLQQQVKHLEEAGQQQKGLIGGLEESGSKNLREVAALTMQVAELTKQKSELSVRLRQETKRAAQVEESLKVSLSLVKGDLKDCKRQLKQGEGVLKRAVGAEKKVDLLSAQMCEVEDFVSGVQGNLVPTDAVGKGFQGVIQTLYHLRDQVSSRLHEALAQVGGPAENGAEGELGHKEEVTLLEERVRVLQAEFREVAEGKRVAEEHSVYLEEQLSRLQREGQKQSLQEKLEVAERVERDVVAAKAEELPGQKDASEALGRELEEMRGQKQLTDEKLEVTEKYGRVANTAKAEELQGQKRATDALGTVLEEVRGQKEALQINLRVAEERGEEAVAVKVDELQGRKEAGDARVQDLLEEVARMGEKLKGAEERANTSSDEAVALRKELAVLLKLKQAAELHVERLMAKSVGHVRRANDMAVEYAARTEELERTLAEKEKSMAAARVKVKVTEFEMGHKRRELEAIRQEVSEVGQRFLDAQRLFGERTRFYEAQMRATASQVEELQSAIVQKDQECAKVKQREALIGLDNILGRAPPQEGWRAAPGRLSADWLSLGAKRKD